MTSRRGLFISFEGGEGSGKSTQARRLHAWLSDRGWPVLLTREPGGEEGAEQIRRLLVEGEPGRWEPVAELLLFLAARYQHYHRTILPALEQGMTVISDRFHDSSFVYQGIGRGLGGHYYESLHALTLGNAAPDLTFYLDIAPELGLRRSTRRRQNQETRFEQLDISFHLTVRNGFLKLAHDEPERVRAIDASGSEETVFAGILGEWRRIDPDSRPGTLRQPA